MKFNLNSDIMNSFTSNQTESKNMATPPLQNYFASNEHQPNNMQQNQLNHNSVNAEGNQGNTSFQQFSHYAPTNYQNEANPAVANISGNTYTGVKANLKFEGNIEQITHDWSKEEKSNRRRLVQFNPEYKDNNIHCHFITVSPNDRLANTTVVSCIYWDIKNEYYITSVDCIYLLEALLKVRFTVEEKNRIRRNLEGFRPNTISKCKGETSDFFKLIMSFPNPKPRNIEKDVKVFPWKILPYALKKIVDKYTSNGGISNSQAQMFQAPSLSQFTSYASTPFGFDGQISMTPAYPGSRVASYQRRYSQPLHTLNPGNRRMVKPLNGPYYSIKEEPRNTGIQQRGSIPNSYLSNNMQYQNYGQEPQMPVSGGLDGAFEIKEEPQSPQHTQVNPAQMQYQQNTHKNEQTINGYQNGNMPISMLAPHPRFMQSPSNKHLFPQRRHSLADPCFVQKFHPDIIAMRPNMDHKPPNIMTQFSSNNNNNFSNNMENNSRVNSNAGTPTNQNFSINQYSDIQQNYNNQNAHLKSEDENESKMLYNYNNADSYQNNDNMM